MSIDLKSYVDQNKAVFLPGYIGKDEVPSDWAEFINYIDFCYKQQDPDQVAMHKEEFMKGGRVRRGLLQIWGYMTIFAENPSVEYFPKLRGMIEKAVKDYGIFVTIEEGIVGLLHISELVDIDITAIKKGDPISVTITRIDESSRKVFLQLL